MSYGHNAINRDVRYGIMVFRLLLFAVGDHSFQVAFVFGLVCFCACKSATVPPPPEVHLHEDRLLTTSVSSWQCLSNISCLWPQMVRGCWWRFVDRNMLVRVWVKSIMQHGVQGLRQRWQPECWQEATSRRCLLFCHPSKHIIASTPGARISRSRGYFFPPSLIFAVLPSHSAISSPCLQLFLAFSFFAGVHV